MSGLNSEGNPFIKTLCQICIDDVVKKFREHMKEKEDAALLEMAKKAENEPEVEFPLKLT